MHLLSTTRIQLSTNAAVAKTNAERQSLRLMFTACLAVPRIFVCCGMIYNPALCAAISAQQHGAHQAVSAGGIPIVGGADRDRTDDPLLAKQMLSQLSYSPIGSAGRNED